MGQYLKGSSGNPLGNSTLPSVLRDQFRRKAPMALDRITDLIHSEDLRIALDASREILNRAVGRPPAAPSEDDQQDGARKNDQNAYKWIPGTDEEGEVE